MMDVDPKSARILLNTRPELVRVYFFILYFYTYYFFARYFYAYQFFYLLKSGDDRSRNWGREANDVRRGRRTIGTTKETS